MLNPSELLQQAVVDRAGLNVRFEHPEAPLDIGKVFVLLDHVCFECAGFGHQRQLAVEQFGMALAIGCLCQRRQDISATEATIVAILCRRILRSTFDGLYDQIFAYHRSGHAINQTTDGKDILVVKPQHRLIDATVLLPGIFV